MKLLALEKELPAVKEDLFIPHLKAEALRVWELYQSGEILEIYFTHDRHTAVIILECEGRSQAEALLQSLPLVKAGLITFEIHVLDPYPGFARLFL